MSTARERRMQQEESLRRQQEDSFNRKDDSGRFKSIYEGLKKDQFWKISEADHVLDIVTYFAGKNNPHMPEGGQTYVVDLYKHQKIGPNEDSYICLSRTYKRECACCDYQNALHQLEDISDEEIKQYNTTRRCIYNVWVKDSEKDKSKGCLVWEVAHFLFEKKVQEYANKGGKKILFASVDKGKSISFTKKGSGPRNTEYIAIGFEERDEQIPDKVLDSAVCLDEHLHIPTYEEMLDSLPDNEITRNLRKEWERKHPRSNKVEEKSEGTGYPVEEDVQINYMPEDQCPAGLNFGSDNGYHDACEKCAVFASCEEEFNRLEVLKKEEEDRLAEEARKKEEEEARRKAEEENKVEGSRQRRRPTSGDDTKAEAPSTPFQRRRR